jgi:hypothetical protein
MKALSPTPSASPPSGPSMPEWALQTERRLLAGQPAPADRFWADPSRILTDAAVQPDPWQATLLRSGARRMLLLTTRQGGKSTTAAAVALKTVLTEPGALVLLLSPSQRQSAELFRKAVDLYRSLGRPVPLAGPRENQLKAEFANGSRLVSLPGEEGTVRGYSGAALLVIDEASRVSDDLYRAARPMLAVSKGRLMALSTPFGKRGFFYEEWVGPRRWERVEVSADQCPRITAEFLAEERLALGERWFRQEYGCSFEDTVGALFSSEDVEAMFACDVPPLFDQAGVSESGLAGEVGLGGESDLPALFASGEF